MLEDRLSAGAPLKNGAVPVLECRGVTRHYGHIHALDGASLGLLPGSVTALVGDNGAGKSTLVRILSGLEPPDAGLMLVDGEEAGFRNPHDVRAAGIETVYQDLALAPTLDLAANVFLGREVRRDGVLGRLGFLARRRMREATRAQLDEIGVTVRDITVPITSLSGGQRQAIAVARAARYATRVILLDEPTAALGAAQTRTVLELTRRAAADGIAVMIISHDLPEVLDVADTVVVLRHGRTVAELAAADTSPGDLLDVMMGIRPSGTAGNQA